MAASRFRAAGTTPLFAWIFLAALGWLAAPAVWNRADHPSARFVLDMTAPASNAGQWYIDLYVNTLAGEPLRAPIRGGRVRYEFPCAVQRVAFLRLDPVQVQNAEVTIHSLAIDVNGAVVQRFTPMDLNNWNKVEPGKVEQDGFHLKSWHGINHIEAYLPAIDVPLPGGLGGWIESIPRPWPIRFMWILFYSVLALPVLALFHKRSRFDWLVLALMLPSVYVSIALTRFFPGAPVFSRQAIGMSAYAGVPKGRDTLVLVVLALVPVAISLFVWWLKGKWSTVPEDEDSGVSVVTGRGRILRLATLGVLLIFVLLYFLWGASYAAQILPKQEIPSGWDAGNVELWAYLYQTDNLPLRDFWYPYGGWIGEHAPFPAGFLFGRGHIALLAVLTGLSFYLIVGRRLLPATIIFVVWFALGHANVFLTVRYALLIPLVLSYASCGGRHEKTGLPHIVFWLCCGTGLLGDIVSLVAGGLAVLAVLVPDVVAMRRTQAPFWNQLRPRLVRDFAVPTGFALLYAVWLAIHGQLAGFVNMLLGLGPIAAYAATPALVDDWLTLRAFDNGFFMWSVAILIGLGSYHFLTDPPKERHASLAVLLLGVADLILFKKQLLHPGVPYDLGVSVAIVGYLILLFGRINRSGIAQKAAVSLVFGMIAGTFVQTGAWPSLWVRFSRPAAQLSDMKALWHPPVSSAEYVRQRWDLRNFRQHSELLAAWDAIRPRVSPAKPRDVFALSDELLLYIVARKRPPYYVSLYDGSTLTAQENTVAWLRKYRPAVAVYNLAHQDVFGVPGIVRAPLLFEEVIRSYVFDTTVGDYAILRLRKAGEPVDLKFWSGALGDINLLALPRYISLDRTRPCREARCAEFLRIRTKTAPLDPAEVSVEFAAAGRRFRVRFLLEPKREEYAIALERLWFWGGLRREGVTPMLAAVSPLVNVEVVRRQPDDGTLY